MLRGLARVVLAQGASRGLLAFGTADNHVHAELATDRAGAGAFARYAETALGWQLGLGARFERARIRPLQDQRHAYHAFQYVHRQDARHELGLDLAREGTSLPDLLGLRVLPMSIPLLARVRTALPRVRRVDLVAQFPAGAFDPIALDLEVLADAAAAAFALPDLRVRSAEATRARRAAVHVAGDDTSSAHLSALLCIGARAIQTLRTLPRDEAAIAAVEKQARLRTRLKAASQVAKTEPQTQT